MIGGCHREIRRIMSRRRRMVRKRMRSRKWKKHDKEEGEEEGGGRERRRMKAPSGSVDGLSARIVAKATVHFLRHTVCPPLAPVRALAGCVCVPLARSLSLPLSPSVSVSRWTIDFLRTFIRASFHPSVSP